MKLRPPTVTVKQLPEALNTEQAQLLALELSRFMDSGRPCLVLDCANLRQMDTPVIYFLLCCLEEALMRDGDVRLAELSPEARTNLESVGVDSLFRIFASSQEAVSSFDRRLDTALLEQARQGS